MEVAIATAATQVMVTVKVKTVMELRWAGRRRLGKSNKCSRIPIFISTNPSHINTQQLRELYTICNHSCHRFPELDSVGTLLEPLDIHKLRIALSHSCVLVSVFCHSNHADAAVDESELPSSPLLLFGDLLQTVMPLSFLSPSNRKLVGFGRAVSDLGLTASIHDVMVLPSLRGMGIGKMVVKRIIRMLTNRDIYDIVALCSPNERLFFKSCGFGDDILGSTTMMYLRTASNQNEGCQMVRCAGQKLLLVPPHREPFDTCKPTQSNN